MQGSKFCKVESTRSEKHEACEVRDCGYKLFWVMNVCGSHEIHVNSSYHRNSAIIMYINGIFDVDIIKIGINLDDFDEDRVLNILMKELSGFI